jgi:phage terminase large subunit-like protein
VKLRPAKIHDTATPHDTRVIDAVLRTVFLAFCQKCFYTLYPGKQFLPNWHHEAIAAALSLCKAASIIVVMQRSKPNDMTGYLLQTTIYRQLKLPLIAVEDEKVPIGDGQYHERKAGDVLHPAWLDTAEIDFLKQETSPATFEALYQQDPKPNGGALLKLDRFTRYASAYKRSDFEYVWQLWDCASSLCEDASYSVCVTVGLRDNKLLVIDVWRKRVEYPELLVAAHRLIDDFAPTHVVVEWASLGQSLLPDLQLKFGQRGICEHDPKGDKLSRAESVIRHFMGGRIALPMEAHTFCLPSVKR